MTARLVLTHTGAAALADGANVGLEGLTFTRLALGSGRVSPLPELATRTALAEQKDTVAVTGSAATPSRIALRSDFMPSETYLVTEVGLLARQGADGAEFLCAYWMAASGADAVASAAAGTKLIVAGVVEVQSAAADIHVAPALDIAIGVPADLVYQSQLGAYATRAWVGQQFADFTASAAEHTQENPPANKAATPAGVRAEVARQIQALGLARTTTFQTIATTTYTTSHDTTAATSYATSYATALPGGGSRTTSRTTSRDTTVSTSYLTSNDTTVSTSYTTSWQTPYMGGSEDALETTRTTSRTTSRDTTRTTSHTTSHDTTAATSYATSYATALPGGGSRTTSHDTSHDTTVATSYDTSHDTTRTTERETAL